MVKAAKSRKFVRKSSKKSVRKSKSRTKKSARKSRTKKSARASRKKTVKSCEKSSRAKYVERPGPPYPANDCKKEVRKGNDKMFYISTRNKNGVYFWKKMHI